MDAQVKAWKLAGERIWSAEAFDYREAARLAGEVVRQAGDATLQRAASQALPGLRAACVKGADQRTRDVAQRRFAAIRDVLHTLTLPSFGKRGRENRLLTPEEQHRLLLGLPLDRRLFGPEIKAAFKQTAKKMHPDAGGSSRAFSELSAARDALMKAL